MPARRGRWRHTRTAAIVCGAVFGLSLAVARYEAAKLTADPYAAPLSQERGALCRDAMLRADWPGPNTAHTWRIHRPLVAALALVEHAWPGHCAVLTVRQDATGRVAQVIVHAATGGERHRRALVAVTTHNQGLPPPPTEAEARHVFALRRWDYAPDA